MAKRPTNPRLLEEYLQDAELQGLQGESRSAYKGKILDFQAFLGRKSCLDVRVSDLKGYLAVLRGHKRSPATLRFAFSAISSFYDFLVFEERIPGNPVPGFRKRYLTTVRKEASKDQSARRQLLSVEDMRRLIHSITDVRDRAFLTLAVKIGARREEVVNIDLEEIDWLQQSILLKPHPKRTNCLVFFDEETARTLRRWIAIRKARGAPTGGALFFLARWGLLGLILVALAPVQGGGVLGAGILGVLLRIPLRRLLLVVVAAGTVMTVGWIFLIKFFSAGLPTHGVYGLLPYAVVVAFLAAGGYGSWRSHRHRFQYQVETLPGTPDAQIIRLKEVGIQEDDRVLKANLATLCRKLGIARKDLSRARHTAELLRLDNLDPSAAERLTAVGIVSIRELAMAPVPLVREALNESRETTWELPSTRLIESWKTAAKAFESQFRRRTKTTH